MSEGDSSKQDWRWCLQQIGRGNEYGVHAVVPLLAAVQTTEEEEGMMYCTNLLLFHQICCISIVSDYFSNTVSDLHSDQAYCLTALSCMRFAALLLFQQLTLFTMLYIIAVSYQCWPHPQLHHLYQHGGCSRTVATNGWRNKRVSLCMAHKAGYYASFQWRCV